MTRPAAVIFDMDGLLLDTEPLWGSSMLTIAQKYEVPVGMPELRYTAGLRIHEVTAYWDAQYPWQNKAASSHSIAEEILEHIIAQSKLKASVLPGVLKHLAYLKSQKIPLGVATSSPWRMAATLLQHFNIIDYFQQISTADLCEFGKPHPAVYLHCAAALGVAPYQCIAVEDTVNGMVAAKAAKMKVVAIPETEKLDLPAFGLADRIYSSLASMDIKDWSKIDQ